MCSPRHRLRLCLCVDRYYFNLSPANPQDKYNNAKAVALLLHMIFKVAKSMAPSVIYIDQADLVFSGGKKKGKKKSADGGKAARIKKDLLAQVGPGVRVAGPGSRTGAPSATMRCVWV